MVANNDRRVIVYPNYINALLTVAKGRRIPKFPGCENPEITEMIDACRCMRLSASGEDKSYPRDWLVRGRLRVELKWSDGRPCNPDVPDRHTLMVKMAEFVARHPNRSKRALAEKAAALQKVEEAASSSNSTTTKPLAPSGGSNKSAKKKGKK